jgi:hypothetical protein
MATWTLLCACGYESELAAMFCSRCGARLRGPALATDPAELRLRPALWERLGLPPMAAAVLAVAALATLDALAMLVAWSWPGLVVVAALGVAWWARGHPGVGRTRRRSPSPTPERGGRRWSARDDAFLRCHAHADARFLARALGRTPRAIRARRTRLRQAASTRR